MKNYIYDNSLSVTGPYGANALRKIAGTNTLYQFCQAADLTLKRVSTLQQAVSCGGVFVLDFAAGRWIMLAGRTLEAAIKRGEDGWLKVRSKHWRFVHTRAHQRIATTGGTDPYDRMRPNAVCATLESDPGLIDFLPSTNLLIMGVLTKGHGMGMGMETFLADTLTSAGTVWPPALAQGDGMIILPKNSDFIDANRLTRFDQGKALWDSQIRASRWMLSMDADLGLARTYFSKNKAAMIAKWKETAGMPDDVFARYAQTFDSTVNNLFGASERLTSQIPFIGGLDSVNFTPDMRVITATPCVDTSVMYMLPSDRIAQEQGAVVDANITAEELKWQTSRIVQTFDYASDAPCIGGLVRDTQYTRDLTASPFELEFGTSRIKTREFVGALSPAAGMSMSSSPVSGVVDMGAVLGDYNWLNTGVTVLPGSVLEPATQAQADATLIEARSTTNAYLDVYTGQLGDALLRFGRAWDHAAQDSN